VKVVSRHQKGETAIAIASSMSVGKTQVQQIIRDKETILKRWEEGESGSRKIGKVKVRKMDYTAIDDAVWGWFLDARPKDIPVTGKLIQEKALCVSMSLGVDDLNRLSSH
jgi:hypothetical protein